ncbi:MAG: hypothetical protein Q8M92_00305, partial [Candidatus Subteraquimicrobiales bacterium]|nr:hypothetical protein [Candidatus Subteraquimicrobiales bacterium]
MKGVFTRIEYMTQGVTMREAKNSGMVVGIPMVTEQQRMILPAEADITLASAGAQPSIDINGTNSAFPYIDGDVLFNMRAFVKKSSEPDSQLVEIFKGGSTIINDKTLYGEDDALATFNPVKNKTLPEGVTGTWSALTRILTLSTPVDGISAGDTVITNAKKGKITTMRNGLTTAEAGVVWDDGGAPEGVRNITSIYYDYTADPATRNSRGYVIKYDLVSYRTSIHGVKRINKVDDLTDMFGRNTLENPLSNLGVGALLYAASSSFSQKFKTCALDLRNVEGLEDESPLDLMDSVVLWEAAKTFV